MATNFATAVDEHPWRNERILRKLYVEKDLSMVEVAEKLDCSQSVISQWCHHHGIETDDWRGEHKRGLEHHNSDPIEEDTLVELHTRRGLTPREIANELERTLKCVRKYLFVYDVEPSSNGSKIRGRSSMGDR